MKNVRGMGVVFGLLGGVLGVLAPEAAYSDIKPGLAAQAQSHTSYGYGNGMILNMNTTSTLSVQVPVEVRVSGNHTVGARMRGSNTFATTCRAIRSDGVTFVQSDLVAWSTTTPTLVMAPNPLNVPNGTHLYFGCTLSPSGALAAVTWSPS